MVKKYIPGETKEQRKARKKIEKQAKGLPVKPESKPIVETVNQRQIYNKPPVNKHQPSVLEDANPRQSAKKISFVLGNGTSRKPINPEELKPHGVVYGCNALYRSFSPDHLIAVDTKMIKEITSDGYNLKNQVWTNPNRYTKSLTHLNLFNPNLGWSSGPSALNLASTHFYETIYILGFDYVGIGKRNELVNNMYTGTPNYKQVNDRATYFGNWQRQTATCIRKNPKIRYIRVVENAQSFVPDSLVSLENLTHITIENFKKRFNLS